MLEKITLIRQVVNFLTFVIIILLFIRLTINMGSFHSEALTAVIATINGIDDILIAPIYNIKLLIATTAPEKVYLKNGFVEPLLLISIIVYMIIRYFIEIPLKMLCQKYEQEESLARQKQRSKEIFYTDWNV